MQVYNVTLNTNLPLNEDVESNYAQLKDMFMYSITAIITGTPTGTISLQASNDPLTSYTPVVGPTNWVTIADSDFSVTTAGKTMWNVTATAYNFVRVAYTDSSSGMSTATATIIFNGKGA